MQLASSGVRAFLGRRAVTTNVNGGTHGAPRSIHTPSVPRPNASVTSGRSTAQTFINHTRTLLSGFVNHLITPGTLRAPHAQVPARSLYSGPVHGRTIQQGLSLPTRLALARPLHAPYLPKAPAVPANVTQVGLGIARNFSTARPIFQNLVQNVPVTGRAFLEADWEIKMDEERQKMRMEKFGKKAMRQARKEMLKAKEAPLVTISEASAEETRKAELELYFPAPAAEVTTYLLIPLAPTPTSRLPLPPAPSASSSHPLLPYALIASLHNSHDSHALRVSSLFARLDGARVFDDPRVRCEARGDPTGLCTVLEVRFEGWEERKVRSVLGEAGTGWCVMEEVWKDREQSEREEMDEALEKMSSIDGSISGMEDSHMVSSGFANTCPSGFDIDPASSFVLPTLDFSASFPIPAAAEAARPDSPYDWTASFPPAPLLSPALSRRSSSSGILSLSEPDVSTPMSDLEFHNAWTAMQRTSQQQHGSDALLDSFSNVSSPSLSTSWFDATNVSPSHSSRRSSGGSDDSWIGFGFSSQFADRMREAEGPREEVF